MMLSYNIVFNAITGILNNCATSSNKVSVYGMFPWILFE